MSTKGMRDRWHVEWREDEYGNLQPEVRTHPGMQRGLLVATVHHQEEETANNAKLIAAAPRLRRALCAIRNLVVPGATVCTETFLAVWATAVSGLESIGDDVHIPCGELYKRDVK